MKRATLAAMLSLVLSLCPTAALRAGFITYDIQSYSNFQSGWTLNGSITTDGTLGILAPDNITAWNFTFSNGTNVFTASSSGGATTIVLGSGLNATASQITLAAPPAGSGGITELDLLNNVGTTQLYYARTDNISEYIGDGGGNPAWEEVQTGSGVYLGGDPWVIATGGQPVASPEPASITLLLTGLGGLVVYRLTRRCHAKVRRDSSLLAHS